MRLHWRLIFSRFGLFSMLPMFVLVVLGLCIGAVTWVRAISDNGPLVGAELLFPAFWVFCVLCLGTISAFHHRKARLVVMAPLAILYLLLAYAVWLTHGVRGLVTGRELSRDKPTRYAHVVA